MERWSGRVALVTGASSGIGEAIVRELVKYGVKVVGLARRVERVEELAKELKGSPGSVHPIKGDLAEEKDILSAFEWIKNNLGGVDILINNAGVLKQVNLTDGSTEAFLQMYKVNVFGLSICTREAIQSMKQRGVDDGHIIHINSVAGHYVFSYPGLQPYTSSKHAVTALTEGLRRELVQQKSKIKITSVSPGGVDTEMVRNPELNLGADIKIDDFPLLKAKDVADAVIYVLGTPPHVQVHELMIRNVGEN